MMHQIRYANEILMIFKMEDCNVTSKPIEPRLKLLEESNELDIDPT